MKLLQDVLAQIGTPLREVEDGIRAAFSDASREAQRINSHLAGSGGKRVRPMLALLSAKLFTDDLGRAIPVGIAAEMIHMATLVHDDVIDRATTRRGNATVNYVWGNHTSVLAGDALLAKALVILVDQTTLEVVRIMAEMIYRMCEGEIAQHATLHDLHQGEDEYFDRIEKKTALFFAACCKAGALMGGATPQQAEALWAYGRHLGMAFQVIDDLLDVSAEEQVVGKPVGHDLESGVLTLPILHLLKEQGEDGAARRIIAKGESMTRSDVERVLAMVRENGAVEYAFGVAKAFSEQAKEALQPIPPSEAKELLLHVVDDVLTRRF